MSHMDRSLTMLSSCTLCDALISSGSVSCAVLFSIQPLNARHLVLWQLFTVLRKLDTSE